MNRAPLFVLIACLPVILGACSGDPGAPATFDPARSATVVSRTSEPTAPTQPAPSTEATPARVTTLRLDDPLDFPEGFEIFVTSGCLECNGPQITGVERLVITKGVLQRTELTSGAFTDVLASADGVDIYAVDCVAGSCGYVEGPRISPTFGVIHSADSGRSWIEEYRGEALILGAVTDSDVLAYRVEPVDALFNEYFLVGERRIGSPPEPGLRGFSGPDSVVWPRQDGTFIAGSGVTALCDSPPCVEGTYEAHVTETAPAAQGAHLAVRWELRSSAGTRDFLLTVVDPSGGTRTFRTRSNDSAIVLNVGGWLDDRYLVGTTVMETASGFGVVLAVIDVHLGTVHRLMHDGEVVRARSVIAAVPAE